MSKALSVRPAEYLLLVSYPTPNSKHISLFCHLKKRKKTFLTAWLTFPPSRSHLEVLKFSAKGSCEEQKGRKEGWWQGGCVGYLVFFMLSKNTESHTFCLLLVIKSLVERCCKGEP